jgi:uncharacterized membrane-anchored protein YhcB (DUF1043 family)
MDVYADLDLQNQTLKNQDTVDQEISKTLDELDEYKRRCQELEEMIQ